MSTTHASTPRETLSRLETLCLMGDVELPLWALRSQIAMALEIIVQVSRFHDGSRKVTHITEVLDLADGQYQTRDLFVFKSEGKDENGKVLGQLEATGRLPTFAEQIKLAGLRFPKEMLDAARARRAERDKKRDGSSTDELA